MKKGRVGGQKSLHLRVGKRDGPRKVSDIEADLGVLQEGWPESLILGKHVQDPSNRHQTLRLIRHLIIEQCWLAGGSGNTIATVFIWITRDWAHRQAHELYRGILKVMGEAAGLRPQVRHLVDERIAQFKQAASGHLKGMLGYFILVQESPKGKSSKRVPLSGMPAIPE